MDAVVHVAAAAPLEPVDSAAVDSKVAPGASVGAAAGSAVESADILADPVFEA